MIGDYLPPQRERVPRALPPAISFSATFASERSCPAWPKTLRPASMSVIKHGRDTTHFTSEAEADQLRLHDPFVILLGVLFDYSIPAERAWRAPYDLRTRLGHLRSVPDGRRRGGRAARH
jgi:hypothetical protein